MSLPWNYIVAENPAKYVVLEDVQYADDARECVARARVVSVHNTYDKSWNRYVKKGQAVRYTSPFQAQHWN